jgi:8-oxo-dGTP pyrophosphatase MutT (NUDIX family)
MKEAVQLVLLNKDGDVLCVSRKDNHSAFGLVGGKVDDGETPEEAAVRETKEETGLDISNLRLVFSMHRNGYMGYTYLADWEGEISTDEDHVVKWDIFNVITHSSAPFGYWNRLVAESLVSMKIIFNYRVRIVGGKTFY